MAKSEEQIKKEAINEAIKAVKQRELLLRTNKVELAGVVLDISMLPRSVKEDKKGNPILDENKQPTFYEDKYWCSIGVIGSEEGVLLSVEQAQNVHQDSTYLFEGRLKNRKFQCHNITEL